LTKFRAQRHDAYRLVIEALLFGVVIFAVARVGTLYAYKTGWGTWLETFLLQDGITYPFAGTAVFAAALAAILAGVGNLMIGSEQAKRIILRKHDNGHLRLLHKAATEPRMVSVTLSCKKVYIGYVLRTPNLSPQEQFVGILPIVSGHRHKDTQELVITTNYGPAISAGLFPPEDFEITVSLASIEIASFFEPRAYPLFTGAEASPPPERAAQAPRLELP
jgi:hypothetical protein